MVVRVAERTPVHEEWIAPVIHRLRKGTVSLRPTVVLSGVVNHNRRVRQRDVVGDTGRREIHPTGNVLDPRRHIGLDGGKHVAMPDTDAQRSAAAHRVPAQINAVRIETIVLDDPRYGCHDTLFGWADVRPFVLLDAPPPVAFVGPAVEIQSEEVVGSVVDVVVTDGLRALQTRMHVMPSRVQHHIQRSVFRGLLRMQHQKRVLLRRRVTPVVQNAVREGFQFAFGKDRFTRALRSPAVRAKLRKLRRKQDDRPDDGESQC